MNGIAALLEQGRYLAAQTDAFPSTTETVEALNHAQEGIEEVAKNPGIIRTWLEGLVPDLLNFAFQVLIALLVYVIGGRIIKWITKLVRRSMNRAGTDEGVKQFMIPVIKYSLYVVLILLLKPFKVGDYIIEHSHNNEGTVTEISIFYTKLLTVDNKLIVIPNGTLSNSSLTNVTNKDRRRVDLVVGIAYEADIRTAKDVIYAVAEKEEARIPEEKPVVYVDNLAASSVDIGLRVWVKTEDYWPARWRMTENIKYALDAKGISIPYQQIDVQIKQ